MVQFFQTADEATIKRDVATVSDMLDVEHVCNYVVIGIDHSADHAPVIVSSISPEDLPPILAIVAMMLQNQGPLAGYGIVPDLT